MKNEIVPVSLSCRYESVDDLFKMCHAHGQLIFFEMDSGQIFQIVTVGLEA